LHYGAAAQQFLELIDRYVDREATLLKSAVYEFEDADALKPDGQLPNTG
jgi:hypothetical protein